jgi:hypothetical protein
MDGAWRVEGRVKGGEGEARMRRRQDSVGVGEGDRRAKLQGEGVRRQAERATSMLGWIHAGRALRPPLKWPPRRTPACRAAG